MDEKGKTYLLEMLLPLAASSEEKLPLDTPASSLSKCSKEWICSFPTQIRSGPGAWMVLVSANKDSLSERPNLILAERWLNTWVWITRRISFWLWRKTAALSILDAESFSHQVDRRICVKWSGYHSYHRFYWFSSGSEWEWNPDFEKPDLPGY